MVVVALLLTAIAAIVISFIVLMNCSIEQEAPWEVLLILSTVLLIISGLMALSADKAAYENILVENKMLKPVNEDTYLEITTEYSKIYISYIEAGSYFNTIHKKQMGETALINSQDAEEPQIKIYEKVFENNFWSYFYTRSKYTYVFEVPACSIKYSCVKTE